MKLCIPPLLRKDGHSGTRLSSVICDDSNDLLFRIEFHKLASLRAFLISVVENDAGDSPHHIQEFEGEVWVGLKPSLEITAHGFFASDGSGGSLSSFAAEGDVRTTSGA